MAAMVYVFVGLFLLCPFVNCQGFDNLPEWMQPFELEDISSEDTGGGTLIVPTTDGQGFQKSWQIHVNNVNVKDPFSINITVEELHVNAADPDGFLLIIPGSPGGHIQSQLLTGNPKSMPQFFLPKANQFYVKYWTTAAGGSLKLNYDRYGDPLPTIPPPIETTPTPPETEDAIYKVYLKVSASNVNDEFMNNFKEAVRIIAEEYCTKMNISFDATRPLDEMVFTMPISSCSLNWNAPEGCTVFPHMVFVAGEEVTTRLIQNYELTASHLEEAWKLFGRNSSSVADLGIKVYDTPDSGQSILAYAIGIPVAVLVLLLILTFMYRIKENSTLDRRISDDRDKILEFEGVELRRKSHLKPSTHQKVPDFWKTKSDVTTLTPSAPSIMSSTSSVPEVQIQKASIVESPGPSEQISPLSPAVSFGGAFNFNFDDRSSFEI